MVLKKLAKKTAKVIKKKAGKAAGVKRGEWKKTEGYYNSGRPNHAFARDVKVDTALRGRYVKSESLETVTDVLPTRTVTDDTIVFKPRLPKPSGWKGTSRGGWTGTVFNVDDVTTTKRSFGKLSLERQKIVPVVRAFEPSEATVAGKFSRVPLNKSPLRRTTLQIGGNPYRKKGIEIISEKGPINNEIGVQFGRYYTMPTRKAKTGAAAVGAGTAAASAGYFGLDYYRKRGRR